MSESKPEHSNFNAAFFVIGIVFMVIGISFISVNGMGTFIPAGVVFFVLAFSGDLQKRRHK